MSQSDKLTIRPTVMDDASFLTEWLRDEKILCWFPMTSEPRELDDSVRVWMSYAKMGAGLTALWDGKPCGMSNLYLQTYKKLKHQCLFALVVEESMRGKGIGARLLTETETLAKEKFQIEILHLEVYQENPAIRLYERAGFDRYGEEIYFIKKKEGGYRSKIMMQKIL